MFNFLSTKAVKRRIAEGSLSENDVLMHCFINVVYDAFFRSMEASRVDSVADTLWYQLVAWSFFICTVATWLVCFFANGAFHGRGLLTKVFPLSVTVGYKYAVALSPADYLIDSLAADKPVWFDAALVYSMNACMALNIVCHIVAINRTPAKRAI